LSSPAMKPAFFAPVALREPFQVPMDGGSPPKSGRDLAGIDRRFETLLPGERLSDAALVRENRFVRRMLNDRDRQLAALQDELSAMRRDWAWRALGAFGLGFRRLRRQFWQADASRAPARRIKS
jgi:hypothetical protein